MGDIREISGLSRLGVRLVLKRFLADERGATAIEYGLIAAMLGIVVATALSLLGDKMYGLINSLVDSVSNAT